MSIVLFLLFLVIYFIPTIVAGCKHHRNMLAIFIINLLLGFTLLGWVGALVWAVYKPEKKLKVKFLKKSKKSKK